MNDRSFIGIFASQTQPFPGESKLWMDLSVDPYGSSIKYWDGNKFKNIPGIKQDETIWSNFGGQTPFGLDLPNDILKVAMALGLDLTNKSYQNFGSSQFDNLLGLNFTNSFINYVNVANSIEYCIFNKCEIQDGINNPNGSIAFSSFRDASIPGSMISTSSLRGNDFTNCNMNNSILSESSIIDCDFTDTNMISCTMTLVNVLSDCIFKRTDFTGAVFSNSIEDRATFTNCIFNECDFSSVDLSLTLFKGTTRFINCTGINYTFSNNATDNTIGDTLYWGSKKYKVENTVDDGKQWILQS